MNKRNIIGCVLISIIIFMLYLIFMNRETIFTSKMDIDYPDGCVETYINNKLITDKCIEGRKLLDRGSQQWIQQINQT